MLPLPAGGKAFEIGLPEGATTHHESENSANKSWTMGRASTKTPPPSPRTSSVCVIYPTRVNAPRKQLSRKSIIKVVTKDAIARKFSLGTQYLELRQDRPRPGAPSKKGCPVGSELSSKNRGSLYIRIQRNWSHCGCREKRFSSSNWRTLIERKGKNKKRAENRSQKTVCTNCSFPFFLPSSKGPHRE